jgi:hypothetical protein
MRQAERRAAAIAVADGQAGESNAPPAGRRRLDRVDAAGARCRDQRGGERDRHHRCGCCRSRLGRPPGRLPGSRSDAACGRPIIYPALAVTGWCSDVLITARFRKDVPTRMLLRALELGAGVFYFLTVCLLIVAFRATTTPYPPYLELVGYIGAPVVLSMAVSGQLTRNWAKRSIRRADYRVALRQQRRATREQMRRHRSPPHERRSLRAGRCRLPAHLTHGSGQKCDRAHVVAGQTL